MTSFSVQSAGFVRIWCHCCSLWCHMYSLLTRCWHLNAYTSHAPAVSVRFWAKKIGRPANHGGFHVGPGSQWGQTSFFVRGCEGLTTGWLFSKRVLKNFLMTAPWLTSGKSAQNLSEVNLSSKPRSFNARKLPITITTLLRVNSNTIGLIALEWIIPMDFFRIF
jgi:hypothetical protein